MTKLKWKSPAVRYWQPRVEGQIRDALHQHPEWFTDAGKKAVVRSLAKRIIGEICAGASLAPMSVGVARNTSCVDPKARGDGSPTAVTTRPERGAATLRSGRGAKFIAAIIALAVLATPTLASNAGKIANLNIGEEGWTPCWAMYPDRDDSLLWLNGDYPVRPIQDGTSRLRVYRDEQGWHADINKCIGIDAQWPSRGHVGRPIIPVMSPSSWFGSSEQIHVEYFSLNGDTK